MLEFFNSINFTTSETVNLIIQAVILEIAVFLAVPLTGIVIDAVIVKGLRRIIAGILGNKIEYAFSNYLLFIGTVIHELSHAFFAFITGAKIDEIALFKPEGNSLGHVSFHTRGNKFLRALQGSFSACAPVTVGLAICYLFITKLFPALTVKWQLIAAIYVFVSVVFHMNMSNADLKVYFKGTLPLLAIFLPISIVLFALA